jgi:hypothetical protein
MTTSASRPAVDRRGAAHSDLVAQSGLENRALAVNGAERLLTVDDLCEYLVSEDFIYDEARHVRLRASRIARQLRFRPADVGAFVAANAVTGCDL